MKTPIILLILSIPSLLFTQVEEYQLCIFNKTNQIYAIIDHQVMDSLNYENENYSELYSDFIFHTNKLKDKISIPVKIYISSVVYYEMKEINIKSKSLFTYLLIRKGDVKPKIIKGVDSWASLKEQVDLYFSKTNEKSKTKE